MIIIFVVIITVAVMSSLGWRQQERHKFAYSVWKWKTIVLLALHLHFSFLDILQTFSFFPRMWNDLFCSRVDDVSIRWQMFHFLKHWFQFNSRIVRTHFSCVMTWNNWEMIAETQIYILRWRSCFRRRCVCLRSLFCPSSWTPFVHLPFRTTNYM